MAGSCLSMIQTPSVPTYRKILEGDGFTVDIAENADPGWKWLYAVITIWRLLITICRTTVVELCRRMASTKTSELVRAILTAQYKSENRR